jgi:hypothetical protein
MTALDAYTLLAKYVKAPEPEVDPITGDLLPAVDLPFSDFALVLNVVLNRFYNSGKWKGLTTESVVNLIGDQTEFDLPATCESILGAQVGGVPVVVFGRFHQFQPGGPGSSNSGVLSISDQGDRSYKVVGKYDSDTEVKLLCKRRFIPITDESDPVLPDNEAALKMGLLSYSYEDNNDLERADQYFTRALEILNGEAREARGAAQYMLQQSPHGLNLGQLRNLY